MSENMNGNNQNMSQPSIPSKRKYFWIGFLFGILLGCLQFLGLSSLRTGLIYPPPLFNGPILLYVFPVLWLGTLLSVKLWASRDHYAGYLIFGLLTPGALLNTTALIALVIQCSSYGSWSSCLRVFIP